MEENAVSVQEASAILGVSTSRLYALKKQGRITIHPPKPARVSRSEVERIKRERDSQ